MAAAIVLNTNGGVASCTITRSSGSPVLDVATCPLVTQGVAYRPTAPDEPRRLIVNLVHWVMPDAPITPADLSISASDEVVIYDPPFQHAIADAGVQRDKVTTPALIAWDVSLPTSYQPGLEAIAVVARFTVMADGHVQNCSSLRSSGYPDLDADVCREIEASGKFSPAHDVNGAPFPALVIAPIDFTIAGSGKSTLVPPVAGSFSASEPLQSWAWIRNSDYPLDSLREQEQGTAVASLDVGTAGRALSCGIVQSTGSKLLDSTTCKIGMTRALFTPALDSDKRPILGVYSLRFRWVLPGEPKSLADVPVRDIDIITNAPPQGMTQSVLTLRYLVDEAGHVEKCEPDRSSGSAALDRAACAATMNQVQFNPIADRTGKHLRTVRTKTIGIKIAS